MNSGAASLQPLFCLSFLFQWLIFLSSNVLSFLFLDDLFSLYFLYLSCNVCVLFTTPYKEVFAK